MSTSYFLEVNVCKCCGRAERREKIAHQSAGWVLRVFNELDKILDDINAPNARVVTDYGDEVDFRHIVAEARMRKGKGLPDRVYLVDRYITREAFLNIQDARLAPSGLLSSKYAVLVDNIDYVP